MFRLSTRNNWGFYCDGLASSFTQFMRTYDSSNTICISRVNRLLTKEKQTKNLYILENEHDNQCANRLLRKKLIINL